MKKLINHLDPYHQSPLFFQWGFFSILFLVVTVIFLYAHARGAFCKTLLDNILVYLPNYLIHEFSHRFWCIFNSPLICYASGNGMETLVPFVLCILSLRLSGGRYLLPPLMYWLSTALYGMGIYASDARAMTLHLTSSDMMSNAGPGTAGDWYYILEPLGLLEYDVWIGNFCIFCAVCCLVLFVWSLWYYWTHIDQYINQRRWDVRL